MAGRSELLRVFVRQCRRRLFGLKVADSTGARLSGGMLPARTMVLRRLLTRAYLDPDERNAGLPLPPSAGGFVTNVALALAGRVAIILNYSLSVLSDLGAQTRCRRAAPAPLLLECGHLRERRMPTDGNEPSLLCERDVLAAPIAGVPETVDSHAAVSAARPSPPRGRLSAWRRR